MAAGRLKAILSQTRQPIATRDATVRQELSQVANPRECDVRQTGDGTALVALVERVAALYRTPPDELAEMKRLALRDPGAAWRCFLVTARTEGIQ